MGRSGPSALRVLVEHAYEPRESLAGWLDALVERTASLFSTELGAVGRIWDAERRVTVGDYAMCLRSSRAARAFASHRGRTAHRIDFLRDGGPPVSARRTVSGGLADDYLRRMRGHFEQAGVHDMRQVTCEGDGLWLTLGVVQEAPRPIVGTVVRWAQVRRHLATALHAQRSFDALRARFDGEGDAQERLREGLRVLDAGSPGLVLDEALALWSDVVRGALRTLDRFEREGRQYHLVASTSEPVLEPGGLTADERELATLIASGRSMKWIALTLGVARSTVNARLRSAVAKLGQRSSLDLVRAFHVRDDQLVPALAPRAHALGSGRYLLAFDRERSAANDCARDPSLTRAQWRVVQLAVRGLGDRAIAQRLDLSRHTVSHHLRHAFARLGVGSRAELFAELRGRA